MAENVACGHYLEGSKSCALIGILVLTISTLKLLPQDPMMSDDELSDDSYPLVYMFICLDCNN